MKHAKKLFAAVVGLAMALALCAVPAFAAGEGTITVNNAAKGEGYAVYKVLDATINSTGGIDYTGEIPAEFANILETVTGGTAPNTYTAVGVKDGVTQDQINAALKAYAVRVSGADSYEDLVKDKTFPNATASKTATGNSVSFDVAPGFYVVVSSQGTTVMADSATNPATAINEKNTTTVTAKKEANGESFSIGDTITYTATFDTANYLKKNGATEAQPVTEYVISDTLPPFLSNATIKSVTVGGEALNPTPTFTNKAFSIEWATYDTATKQWTSLYNNGAKIVVVYEATLTSTTNIGKEDTNTVSIQPKLGKNDGTEEEPTELKKETDETIKTYAAALKKVDENDAALAGAEFTVKGLIATEKEAGSGIWIVTSYDANSEATPTTLTTDAQGKLYIVGLKGDAKLAVTETKAPDGYNKLNAPQTLTPQEMETTTYKTTSWEKYDAKGNLIDSKTTETTEYTQTTKSLADLDAAALQIKNNKGTELPSTGGMGTTIIYVIGGIMVLLAAVYLITKRRVAKDSDQ